MFVVLDKDTIVEEIIPHLPKRKRGFKPKSPISEIINCILYKLKTGVQWALLPMEQLFSEVVPSYKTVPKTENCEAHHEHLNFKNYKK
ncbi:transposase [Capnocytophaga canimorsus]|uniref:transposase n=1 Tax=Capnocytophaga canimorsus TaxID=28188 RepID=UPI001E37308B|nr:transposase [Capnocytophaga canimorsus]